MTDERGSAPAFVVQPSFDVAVIGAGVFGAWIAYTLQRSGRRVLLVDAYGPGNLRSCSGGETRIIRTGYGVDEIYSRMAVRSLQVWKDFARDAFETIFCETGVLHLAGDNDPHTTASWETLKSFGVLAERLSRDELERRYPQMVPGHATWGLLEPGSGVIMARRAVNVIVRAAVRMGAVYRHAQVMPPAEGGLFAQVSTNTGDYIGAEQFVFACGPWLPTLFPAVIGERIRCTRQEVFFFGVPAGNDRFCPPNLPSWLHFTAGIYGVPDIDHRGVKIAVDKHGPPIDPELTDRSVAQKHVDAMRTILKLRFPALVSAPLLEVRVCQYENTWNGDLLIDRHPTFRNLWIVGGGSGHGFKHGPAVAEYLADRLSGSGRAEPRFSLASKSLDRARSVY